MHSRLNNLLHKPLHYIVKNSYAVVTQSNSAASSAGLFGNFLLNSPKGFELLTKAVHARSVQLVQEIVDGIGERAKNTAKKTTVSLVDDLSNEICSAADLSDCVRCMHNDPEWAQAAENAMRFFTILVETLNTTPELYGALKESLTSERQRLDEVSERTAKLLVEDFEQSGVQLDENERQQFVHLSNEIFDSGTRFVANCDRPVPLSSDERYRWGIADPELNGPFCHQGDYQLRKVTHSKYFGHNKEQETFLRRLVSARHDLALLTNFQSFAHRAQLNSVLCTYENVHQFLKNTIKELSPKCEVELEEMRSLVRKNSQNYDVAKDGIGEWDLEFATMLKRHFLFQKHKPPAAQHLSTHFHLTSVLECFEWLVRQLYGIHFKKLTPVQGECWQGNVLKLNVHRMEDDKFLGTIFLDLDARSSKMQGDCHFTVRCSKLLDSGEYQTPIVVLSLSVVPDKSTGDVFEKTTMSVQQAENFFHEMGHAMHSILGRTRFQHVAGTRCPTDFAEVPSHLMECFFNDPKILFQICRDKSGRPLPEEQIIAIVQSRRVFEALHTMRQATYALFDLELHGERAADINEGRMDTSELFRHIYTRAFPMLEKSEDYAYHQRISHLVTYGAKYYSYLVARASASLIYEKLFADNQLSRENGMKWEKVQSHGGEFPSNVLLAMALDRDAAGPPTPAQLTEALAK